MKINQIITLLALLILQPSIGMQLETQTQEKQPISNVLKNELISLLHAELIKKPQDISRRADRKLQEIITASKSLLTDKVELAHVAQTLKIDTQQLAKLLNNILQRAQTALDISTKKTQQLIASIQSAQVEVKPASASQPQAIAIPAPTIPLWQAADQGDIAAVKWHISHGTNVNSNSPSNETPLMLAAGNGHKEIVMLLINAGANLNQRTTNGYTALRIALLLQHPSIAKELIAAGTDVNLVYPNGTTALIIAVRDGYEDIVKDLIAAGANTNAKDDDNITALMMAAFHANHRLVKVLLDAGAHVNDKDNTGKTALDYAKLSNVTTINLLTDAIKLQTIPSKSAKEAEQITSPLPAEPAITIPTSSAIEAGWVTVSKAPKEQINVPQITENRPPLIKAAKRGDIQTVKQLLKEGADINARDTQGNTALGVAARWGYIDLTNMLLARKANPNIAEETGLTPLHDAVIGGHIRIVQSLLDKGADINARDTHRGRTPLHWVVRMTVGAPIKIAKQNSIETSIAMLNLLLSRGANPSIVDYKNNTPLKLARALKLTPLVQVLEKAQ